MTDQPTYHKINSVFKRDPTTSYKTFLFDEFADPAFEYLYRSPWQATEKVDGTNMRIHLDDGLLTRRFTIGGRTHKAEIPKPLYEHCTEIADRASHVIDSGAAPLYGLTLYGEGYGAGIQKGGGYRDDQGFILFDVMVTETGTFLERENVESIARLLDIPVVPIVDNLTLEEAVSLLRWTTTTRTSSSLRNGQVEGWVLRPLVELRNRLGHRVITKLKLRDFT